MSAAFTPGTCRYCGCSEGNACVPRGCTWAESDPPCTLCDVCAGAEDLARKIVTIFHEVATSTRRTSLRLVGATWEEMTHKHRQLLVISTRASSETITETLLEALTEEHVQAGVELNLIVQFLHERCPQELREGQPVSATVMRLLEPHVGSRIILPGGPVRS